LGVKLLHDKFRRRKMNRNENGNGKGKEMISSGPMEEPLMWIPRENDRQLF